MKAGDTLGPGPARTITQADVDRFAAATGDDQWIHVDPERAADGPFGGTIAHGYLSLAVVPAMLRQLVAGAGWAPGPVAAIGKVRFPAPVLVGSDVHLSAIVTAVDGEAVTVDATLAVVGAAKPACAARMTFGVA